MIFFRTLTVMFFLLILPLEIFATDTNTTQTTTLNLQHTEMKSETLVKEANISKKNLEI